MLPLDFEPEYSLNPLTNARARLCITPGCPVLALVGDRCERRRAERDGAGVGSEARAHFLALKAKALDHREDKR